jgi:hypothetical protein
MTMKACADYSTPLARGLCITCNFTVLENQAHFCGEKVHAPSRNWMVHGILCFGIFSTPDISCYVLHL